MLHPYLFRSSSRPLSLVSKADGNRSSVDPANPRQTGISQRLVDPLFVPLTTRGAEPGCESYRYGWSFGTPHPVCHAQGRVTLSPVTDGILPPHTVMAVTHLVWLALRSHRGAQPDTVIRWQRTSW